MSDPPSEDTSINDEEWEKEGDVSITSLPMSKDEPVSSPSICSQSSELENKRNKWARLLGVVNRPNPLEDWDQLYNLPNQSMLRNDCRKLAKAIDNKKSVPELESLMTLYCKKRNVDFKKDNGWLTVLEKMLKYEIPPEQLFNIFFAFTTKYIPKESKDSAQIYDLFRLVLQYHDPQVSSHLDSLKCPPVSYTQDLFSTVFASSLDEDTCRTLWDLYIEKGDPFLVFHMAVVLVINARDDIMNIGYNDRAEVVSLLKSLPTQISIEDASDFIQLASYYSERTPQSLREDYHYKLFGANYDDEVGDMSVSRIMCLPLTVHELTRKDRGTALTSPISYFIIDARSQEAYAAGHIYGSFNLDCQLFVDNPNQFEIALNSLEAFKNEQKFEEHVCLMGYGDETKDQFMYMVLSRFLREGKAHVSFVQGGFKALHTFLSESKRLRSLDGHSDNTCVECGNTPSKSWSLMGKMKEVVISKSASVKEKVTTLVSPTLSDGPGDVHHVVPSDRHGKRYRNEPSVFSIDDGSSDEETANIFNKPADREELLLSDQAEFIDKFSCHEVADDRNMYKAYIALTRTHLHVLREVPNKPGYVTTEARHPLSSVVRVTSKKKVPELLTFKFGYEIGGETKVTGAHRFLVPMAGECAKAVKTAIFTLRPLTDPGELE